MQVSGRCASGPALIPSLDFAALHHHIRASLLLCGLTKISRDRATRLSSDGASSRDNPQKRAVPAARGNGPKAALHTRARKARSAAKRTLIPVSNVSFADLGLAEPLLRALEAANYTVPTPIQARTIPALLQGRDVLGIAQTGTGKTAAFALPMLQHLSRLPRARRSPSSPRCLVLAPTRELAVQIARSFDTYGRGLGLRLVHRRRRPGLWPPDRDPGARRRHPRRHAGPPARPDRARQRQARRM